MPRYGFSSAESSERGRDVDVLRSFTTAAVALAGGARAIYPVSGRAAMARLRSTALGLDTAFVRATAADKWSLDARARYARSVAEGVRSTTTNQWVANGQYDLNLGRALYVFGKLGLMIGVSRFTKTLSTLLRSGVPLVTALDITRRFAVRRTRSSKSSIARRAFAAP